MKMHLVLGLCGAVMMASGCKRSAEGTGGTGNDTGVIYSRGSDSDKTTVKADGRLSHKDNTNATWQASGSNGPAQMDRTTKKGE